MELPANILSRYSQPKAGAPRTQRQEILDRFVEKLNTPGYPMTYGRLVKIFEGVPTSDLHPFYRMCEGARSFSRMFWYRVKNKKTEV